MNSLNRIIALWMLAIPALCEKSFSQSITIKQVWQLPQELVEISSNVLIDEQRMACVQDNTGTIYIYNLTAKKIERRIVFTGEGDFEALSFVEGVYYVLRSDGMLYKVQDVEGAKPVVTTFDLPLNAPQDTEPMFYDAAHRRLLIGVKELDPTDKTKKGVYSFDLKTQSMSLRPVVLIDAGGTQSPKKKGKGKGQGAKIRPSEIAIHPTTGELYVLDGPRSALLVVNTDGSVKSTTMLDKSTFPQPEGMCFTPSGELYISSEGTKKGADGIIALVHVK
jgi:uncharacterized protein YjiK